jgi:hypothetical protein
MANLTIALTDPLAAAQFVACAEELMASRGQLSIQVREALSVKAAELNVHWADVERLIEQAKALPRVQQAFVEAARRAAREVWLEFTGVQLRSVALIVDASQSAAAQWDAIHRYAGDLIRRLSSVAHLRLFFLGNASPFDAAEFETKGNIWHDENMRRASFITPIFTALENEAAGDSSSLIVLGAGRIFDLADWQDTPLLQASRFISFGDSLTQGLCLEEELTADALAGQLCSALAQVSIGANGAVPFFWNNPDYQWEQDCLRLKTANTVAHSAVRIGWLCAPDATPQATITLQNGHSSQHELGDCAPLPVKCRWQSLTQSEAATMEQQLDSPSPNGQRLNYPTLQGRQGIVLLRNGNKGATYCHLPCPALRLPNEQAVALWDNASRRAEIMRFNDGNWTRSGEALSPYHPVAENVYAIVL